MIKSCYIHIPFCENICTYCDFCKRYYNKKYINKYLNSLEKEIDSLYKNEVLDTIYIGGGTPSCLDIEELELLFRIINKLNKSKNCSITIEANFESINKDKLDLFKKNGINRISFGLESINKNNLLFMDRELDKNKVINTISYCKEIGINDINVDLIYALPNEDINILKEDIDFILDLDITHISTYSLIIEEHTIIYINKVKNISEDLDNEMYKYICNRLKENGFIHYEISNFCKAGYESKHNLCYWKNLEYYGFGLGASGFIKNKRYINTKSISKYIDGNYIDNYELLNKRDLMEYEVILNLRIYTGIDLDNFYNKYNIKLEDVYNYKDLVKDGLLKLDNNNLYIDEDKWYISNSIIVRLLEGEIDG